jgi:hypothetical protein
MNLNGSSGLVPHLVGHVSDSILGLRLSGLSRGFRRTPRQCRGCRRGLDRHLPGGGAPAPWPARWTHRPRRNFGQGLLDRLEYEAPMDRVLLEASPPQRKSAPSREWNSRVHVMEHRVVALDPGLEPSTWMKKVWRGHSVFAQQRIGSPQQLPEGRRGSKNATPPSPCS